MRMHLRDAGPAMLRGYRTMIKALTTTLTFGERINNARTAHLHAIFLAGKTCCAFDCYTCGRLGGVRQKRKAKSYAT